MLPGRGLIARIRGKGDAYGAILASWALGPPQCKEGMRGFMGRRGGRRRWRARRVAALGQATQRVAASAERARRTQRWWARWARQWWVLRCRGAADRHGGAGAACGDAALAGSAAIASWHVVAWARAWQRWRAERDAGGRAARRRWDAALVAALGLTARRARWKRVTVGREGSGLTRRNTPTRAAVIRPNWRALPQRALRALR